MPVEFTGLQRGVVDAVWVSTDAWFGELGNREERESRGGQFEMVARLKPGVTPERAAAQMDAAIRGSGKHKPAPVGAPGTTLTADFTLNWRQRLVAGAALLLLLGVVLFAGCANVAQLRLAQAESRKRELGVRMALGASPWRLTRLLLVETAMVSAAGAGLGILLAQFLMRKVGELISAGMESFDPGLRLDYRVLSFTLVAALASVLLAGLAPARQAVRLNMTEVLKSGQGVAGLRAGWQRRVLIVGQVVVSVLLFGMAVQFLQSLRNAAEMQPGLDPRKKMLVMDAGPGHQWPHTTWCEQACERLSGLSGVRGATFARRLPLSGSGGGLTVRVEIPGQAPLGVRLNNVGGNYFSLMGTRVVAGRGIDANDRNGSPLVVVVSQQFVREVFQGRSPLGEWVRVEGQPRQVVGVAGDGPSINLHENPEPYLYLPFAQAPVDDIALMVETAGEPEALAQAVRRELKSFDPGVTLTSFQTLRQHMDQALSMDRMMTTVVTGLGVFSLLLTSAGLFGVIQCLVNQRTREIGLRVALGAPSGEIQRMVLAESLRMVAWGIPIGLAALGAAVWSVRSVVLGVTPANPLTYLASSAATVALALTAAWLPARRAAGVDPMAALRSE
jgi:putative ABC transport system permease protein